jgi:hypothetical protein
MIAKKSNMKWDIVTSTELDSAAFIFILIFILLKVQST